MITEMAACVPCSHILLRMALGVGQSAASQMAEIFITNIPPGFVIFQSRWAQLIEVFSTQPCNRCLLAYWPSRYWPHAWGSSQPLQVGSTARGNRGDFGTTSKAAQGTNGGDVDCVQSRCSVVMGQQMFHLCWSFRKLKMKSETQGSLKGFLPKLVTYIQYPG